VIGLSVNAKRENHEAMIQAGAAKLITKDAIMDELYRAIQELVRTDSVREKSRLWRTLVCPIHCDT
jgi:DNA-binding NarL/FixJ family response regulator